MYQQKQPLVLASLSPRRFELLRLMGLEPQRISQTLTEEIEVGGSGRELAVTNAKLKFVAAVKTYAQWVLTADTVVELGTRTLGKPRDAAEAAAMLGELSGQTHMVATAYCLGQGGAKPPLERVCESKVTFRPLSQAEIEAYIATGEPMDKAGSYGVQGAGGGFIARIDGSYANVMGLPVLEVMDDLLRLGVVEWRSLD